MPLYLFSHITTGEVHEVSYHMNETKDYAGPNGKQVGKWKRIWTKPQAAFDTQNIDPYSARDFVKATAKGKGVIGDLWERSAELSAKREAKEGKDPHKEAYYKRFSDKRMGKKHPLQVREEGAKKLRDVGVKIDWGDR